MEEGDITEGRHDAVHSVEQREDEAEVTERHPPPGEAEHGHVPLEPLRVLQGLRCHVCLS